MYDSRNYELVISQGMDLVGFYRQNPCVAAYDLLRVDLAPIQRLVFEDMWFKNYALVIASRGFGKTYLLAVLACLSCMLYPGYRVGLIGPVFRQAKLIFAEIEKLYLRSPIMREACEKRPTRGSDTCYLKFKSVSGHNPSYVEALPLGDGSKIRGSRFFLIIVDELAQVPPYILDTVIRPMAATQLEPMENVRRLERQRKLIELGLATQDDFEESTVNKMIMTSSGFFKFNHMWSRMKDYWRQMDLQGENTQYAVWQIPYWDLPEGFLDKNNIDEARRTMPESLFKMEYEAVMISDSEGFFKASLIEACSYKTGFTFELKGEIGANYVLGIDPNQGGDASCGIIVVKLGNPNKIVNIVELKRKTTQEMALAVQNLCEVYNILRIFMDKGGGGKAIQDLLEEGYGGYEPLIDRTDELKTQLRGRHILDMVHFNPAWISDANFTTLSMLEDKKLLFPEPPLSASDALGSAYVSLDVLKKQLLNIVVTQTPTGILHFDTPKKGQNKDLYSALILAAHGARLMERELGEPEGPVLYNKSGFVKEHANNSSWKTLSNKAALGPPSLTSLNKNYLNLAVLKKKPK